MTQELLSQFQSATSEFVSTAKALPAEKLVWIPAPGEWPATYVIHHLADSDAHFLVRFLNVLSVDNPHIIPFDEEAFPSSLHYEGRNISTSLDAVEASAAQLVEILRQVDESTWSRTGLHKERGVLTLTQLLQLTINHRVEHTAHLKGLLA